MSLVAPKEINPIEGDAPDLDDGGAVVKSGAFWPEITLRDLRTSMRINGKVTTDRLMHATTEAVLHTNDQLKEYRFDQEKQGHASLEDVPAELINDVSPLVYRYRRAVYSITKVSLTERYRDIDTTRDGEKHAEALSTQIDMLWRDARWSIRDILGEDRGLAELV